MKTTLIAIALMVLLAATAGAQEGKKEMTDKNTKTATFAGGCFWCIESDLEKLDGVIAAVSGYAGGQEKNPTYKQVAMGVTGHREAVQVTYDPKKVTYEKLLQYFFEHIDPTDDGGQFVDRGHQYSPAVFYHDDAQKSAAEKQKQALAKSSRFDKPIVVDIEPLKDFYPAEDYHQDFYKKEPSHYKSYRRGSGRDQFIEKKQKR